jgi:hypothetical protein
MKCPNETLGKSEGEDGWYGREIAPVREIMRMRDKLLSSPLGIGSAPLGNLFRNIPEAVAAASVCQQRIRYD